MIRPLSCEVAGDGGPIGCPHFVLLEGIEQRSNVHMIRLSNEQGAIPTGVCFIYRRSRQSRFALTRGVFQAGRNPHRSFLTSSSSL